MFKMPAFSFDVRMKSGKSFCISQSTVTTVCEVGTFIIIYSSLFTETVAKNNYIQKKIYATT